ncbi:MAG: aminotransferase class V-fold PLP-dependent enzyme [Verrucomicrobiia bacterium]
MTLEQLHRDNGLRQKLFPITQHQIFMAHAGVSPLPQPAYEAIEKEARTATTLQQESDYHRKLTHARQTVARIFKVETEEVALLGPTSLGLNLVANGLDWKPGDEVIFYPDDYPTNVYPWLNLEMKGVKLVPLEPKKIGEITPELIAKAITPRCKLVALASANFLTGYTIDVSAIGKIAHEAGALFSLDAIQTLGAIETPLDEADFVSADSHKWMLGPLAAGVFIVKKHVLDRLKSSLLGSPNVQTQHFVAATQIKPVEGAARYESGAMNLIGIAGMIASLELLESIGISNIENYLRTQRRRLVEVLQSRDFEFPILPAEAPGHGVVTTFRHPKTPTEQLFRKLLSEKIIASHRWSRDGKEWIRLSPHCYILPQEMEQTLNSIVNFK